MSESNSNLDLTEVDSEDLDKLADKIEKFYKADNNVKSALAYHWERNHMFLDGKQWILYEGNRATGGQWQPLSVSKQNEYIPRPVTNYIFDDYQTLKSYLTQNRPRSKVMPNTTLYQDKQSAKLATLVCEANYKRLKEDSNYEHAAATGITYGTVFKKDYWDTTTVQMAEIPRMEDQPVFDPNTGMQTGTEPKEVVDPETGQVVMDRVPLGDANTYILEPYRIAMDPLSTSTHDCRWIMEYTIQPLDWIEETYGKQGDGYTGRVDEVEAEKTLSNAMQRFYQLKNSSGTKNLGAPSGTGNNSSEMIENAAVVKEYYERPTRRYPSGRLIVVANGITLYAGDSPYSGPELGDWHPYSEFRWEIVPGRFWGKSPLDDSCEIQKHINSIDAAIILVRKTTAMPQKLIPLDSGVKRGEWTGRPGQEVFYRANGAAPATVPGSSVPQEIFQERQQRREDMKACSGAIDILKGDRPAGVNAASALEMLFEVGTGKLRPVLDRWKTFIESSQKKQLRNVARGYKEPRKEFIQLLHSLNKEIPEEVINAFIGTDLHDNCNVVIEAGSNIPKLESTQKALLIQLAQIGTLNLQDPKNMIEFNSRLGIIGFDNEVSPDVSRAEWENDVLDNAANTPDNQCVVLADEDHQIHKQIHLSRMKEPNFMKMPKEVMDAYQKHLAEHDSFIQQAQTEQMMQAAMTGAPPPASPQGPPTVPIQSHGKGLPAKLQSAVIAPDVPKLNTR